ncbi:IclR family transcriptional regulator domain-containing protein [Pseudarthrobacter sp. Y6]|uniref:IclR family transcriptional regulator domain-containing protein n=1 Tax=Pseudarthrobacter sp. Y6 TaxID=3418422 RepID=UPI003CE810F4
MTCRRWRSAAYERLAALQEELERVRERGVAFEREESTLNVFCAAAPVRDGSGAVVAAISTSVSSAHWHQRPEECWADLVQQGADRLSALLGFTDPHRPASTRQSVWLPTLLPN